MTKVRKRTIIAKYDFGLFEVFMENIVSKELRRYNYLLSETDSAYHEASVKTGLSDSVSMILYTLYENGGECLIKDVRNRSGMSKQTAGSAVKKLKNDGIVGLFAEGRTKRIKLTEKGKTLADNTVKKIIEAENDVFSSWKKEDVENYFRLTEKYLEDFRKRIKEKE